MEFYFVRGIRVFENLIFYEQLSILHIVVADRGQKDNNRMHFLM